MEGCFLKHVCINLAFITKYVRGLQRNYSLFKMVLQVLSSLFKSILHATNLRDLHTLYSTVH